jgi:hypothetical protein
MSLRCHFVGKLGQQSAQLSLKRLFDQLPRSRPDQIGERIGGKSGWIRQGGDGIFSHVAYPFLFGELTAF